MFSKTVPPMEPAHIASNENHRGNMKKAAIAVSLFGIGSVGLLLSWRYKTCRANEWLAHTGFLIKGTELKKKCLVLPFQEAHIIKLDPRPIDCTITGIVMIDIPF
jgi:hypothetical protein